MHLSKRQLSALPLEIIENPRERRLFFNEQQPATLPENLHQVFVKASRERTEKISS